MTEIISVRPTKDVPALVGLVVSSFNQTLTEPLAQGARSTLSELEVSQIIELTVPGALELPVAAAALAERGCQVVVAVGAVIEGETDHYRLVVDNCCWGLMKVSLQYGIPVTNAVLAARQYQQAWERSQPGPSNKGREAALAGINTFQALRGAMLLPVEPRK